MRSSAYGTITHYENVDNSATSRVKLRDAAHSSELVNTLAEYRNALTVGTVLGLRGCWS